MEKVSSILRQQSAQVISHEYLAPNTTVTVTHVDVSPDIKNATVWISVLGKNVEAMTKRLINSAAGTIARAVAESGSLRTLPHIHISIDTSGEHAERISRLLNSMKQD